MVLQRILLPRRQHQDQVIRPENDFGSSAICEKVGGGWCLAGFLPDRFINKRRLIIESAFSFVGVEARESPQLSYLSIP